MDTSRTDARPITNPAPRYDAEQEREDQDDLRELQRSGASIVLPPTALHANPPVVIDPVPLTNSQEDEQGDGNPPTPVRSNYTADWISRRGELNDLWELEQSGQSVVWQDPQDRANIILANQQDLTTVIAAELNGGNPPGNDPPASDAARTYDQRHEAVVDPGLRQLITMLDYEGGGTTVHWVQPQDRDRAISGRLALFRQTDTQSSDPPGSAPQDALAWPDFSAFEAADDDATGGDAINSLPSDGPGDALVGHCTELHATTSPSAQGPGTIGSHDSPCLSSPFVNADGIASDGGVILPLTSPGSGDALASHNSLPQAMASSSTLGTDNGDLLEWPNLSEIIVQPTARNYFDDVAIDARRLNKRLA